MQISPLICSSLITWQGEGGGGGRGGGGIFRPDNDLASENLFRIYCKERFSVDWSLKIKFHMILAAEDASLTQI